MKSALIILISIITIYLYDLILGNALLGLIVVIFSFFTIKPKYDIDKRFSEFMNVLSTVSFVNIEEAIDVYKEEQRYLIRLFNKKNTQVIEEFKKLKTTHKDLDRFVEIQIKKNEFIEKSVMKRNTAYAISLILYVIAFIPFIYLRYKKPIFYYILYKGGYYLIFLLSLIFILAFNLNFKFINKNNDEELSFYDNYSLCFHKNCMDILQIKDERLNFDHRGIIKDINYEPEIKFLNFYSFLPLVASSIIGLIFILA